MYNGLIPQLMEYANWKGFDVNLSSYPVPDEVNSEEVQDFLRHLPLIKYKPRKHQIKGFYHAVKNDRATLLSATASGKSLIIYMLWHWYRSKGKVLLIVPRVALAKQMLSDFEEYYGAGLSDQIQLLYSETDRIMNKPFIISTWQTLQHRKPEEFEDFTTVMLDEAHNGKASSIRKIIGSCINARYRFGLTGTIDNSKDKNQTTVPKLIIEGLFGPAFTVAETAELIEKKINSEIDITAFVLKHSSFPEFESYQDEVEFLCAHEKRNEFIAQLARTREGATLVFFHRVEKHGEVLHEILKKNANGKNVYIIHSKIGDTDYREEIRKIVNKDPKALLLASYGTMQEGSNIPDLRHIILAAPTKSRIRLLQSIGRGARRDEEIGKTSFNVYDIADDMQTDEFNSTLEHFKIRYQIYMQEKFPVTMKGIDL